MHIRQELCSFAVIASKYFTQVAHDVFELQVKKLRWRCMQQMMHGLNKKTVLEYAVAADSVTDTELMDVCTSTVRKQVN